MQRPKKLQSKMSHSAHPDIIARATVDTTIAIIPASAFRRLIRIYPKATAHIVHVILSRFQKVTLATAYNYLGLMGRYCRRRKIWSSIPCASCPTISEAMRSIASRKRFSRERERIGEEEVGKGIALHNARAGRRRRSTTTLRKEAALQALSRQRPASLVATSNRASVDVPDPGDLLTNSQSARTGGYKSAKAPNGHLLGEDASPLAQRSFNPFASQRGGHISIEKRDTMDEDSLFRESILECMFKSIGLTSTNNSSRDAESIQGSPRLVSFDQRRQKAVFSNNAFGFMDAFEGSADADTESMTSGGFAMHQGMSPHMLAQELKDEVEIVFFPKGSILVEHGERNPGLYYVLDGFLDMCVPVEGHSGDGLDPKRSSSSFTAMENVAPYNGLYGLNGSSSNTIRRRPKARDYQPSECRPDQAWWSCWLCWHHLVLPIIHRRCRQNGCLCRISSTALHRADCGSIPYRPSYYGEEAHRSSPTVDSAY